MCCLESVNYLPLLLLMFILFIIINKDDTTLLADDNAITGRKIKLTSLYRLDTITISSQFIIFTTGSFHLFWYLFRIVEQNKLKKYTKTWPT